MSESCPKCHDRAAGPSPEALELRRLRLRECMDILGGDPMDPEAAVVVGMLVKLYGTPLVGGDRNEGKTQP